MIVVVIAVLGALALVLSATACARASVAPSPPQPVAAPPEPPPPPADRLPSLVIDAGCGGRVRVPARTDADVAIGLLTWVRSIARTMRGEHWVA